MFGPISAHAYAQIASLRDTHQLNRGNFNPPLKASLAADLRKIFSRLAVPDGVPFVVRKFSTKDTSAGICNGIVEIIYLEKCFTNIGDRPGDHRFEGYTVAIGGGRGQAGKPRGARYYVVLEHHVKIEREAPVEAGLGEHALKFTEAQLNPLFIRSEDYKR